MFSLRSSTEEKEMIIIVFGLPGTGKSHLARRLAAETGLAMFNTDIIRKEMGKQGQYDAETNNEIYKQLLKRTSEAARENGDVVVDGTFRKKHYRDMFKEEADRLGEKVVFVEMKAADETVKERMKEDRRYSEAGYDEYMMIKDKFEDMKEEHPVLWSDRLEADEMVEQINDIKYEEGADRQAD
ncbi:MAG: ATP-binding protein [Bacteroidales bacterium]|nr:ATP-binding protein [Bacteroidales bacterium]